MHVFAWKSCKRAAITCVLGMAVTFPLAAPGQERHDRGHDERYRTPHWVYDTRFHHDHYYPSRGYVVAALPPGYITLGFGNRRLFFHGGVWYQPAPSGFVVVQPPLGVVVPVLPPAYTMITEIGRAHV
jgi:hypothetical protein